MFKQNNNFYILSIYNTEVYVKGLTDVSSLIDMLKKLPSVLFSETDRIFIHNAKQFDGFDSTYTHGIIEIDIDSVQSLDQLGKLIVHELVHSLESIIKESTHPYNKEYVQTEQEYIQKRTNLLNKLNTDPNIHEKPSLEFFETINYSKDFDDYLYNVITYPVLQFRINNIFPSPYAITSISEYICVGFEIYLFENNEWLKIHCPSLYELIQRILHGNN